MRLSCVCLVYGLMVTLSAPSAQAAGEQPSWVSQSPVPNYIHTGSSDMTHFAVVDKATADDDAALLRIANDIARTRRVSQVIFWTDASRAATRIPMGPKQIAAEVARVTVTPAERRTIVSRPSHKQR